MKGDEDLEQIGALPHLSEVSLRKENLSKREKPLGFLPSGEFLYINSPISSICLLKNIM